MRRLPSAGVLVLHLSGGRDAWGRAGDRASRRVDDGYRAAVALGHRLIYFCLLLRSPAVVVVGRMGVARGAGNKEGRSRVDLLLMRRGFRRS